MNLKGQLISVATTFADLRGLSQSRVSTIVFGDGKVLDRLQGSSDITTGRYEAAMAWFNANWPDGASWPDHVHRPAVREAAE